MNLLHLAIDLLLHLDRYLVQLLAQYGLWVYGLLFAAIFAETGLVVTPFLPGDSLLFGAGALAAAGAAPTGNAPPAASLSIGGLFALLTLAAVLGNSLNYSIGRWLGQRVYSGHYRFIKQSYLQRTEAYFIRHGGLAVVLSRFMPIVRTFAPFIAGVGRMPWPRFQLFNVTGGALWTGMFLFGGYAFGNLSWVKTHFGVVTLGVIMVSLLPLIVAALRDRQQLPRVAP